VAKAGLMKDNPAMQNNIIVSIFILI